MVPQSNQELSELELKRLMSLYEECSEKGLELYITHRQAVILFERIKELEDRIELALKLDYTGQIGWITYALRGEPISDKDLWTMKTIIEMEGFKLSWK